MRNKTKQIILGIDNDMKGLFLEFLLESQMIEYGIVYLLSELPFIKGKNLEDISKKPLGALADELEKQEDSDLSIIAKKVRLFNNLRIEVIHYLLFSDLSVSELQKQLIEKISLAREIEEDIDLEFDDVYQNVLGIPYGSIFE